jgi:uncharacterized membrane protein (DUF485 family)
MWNQRETLVDPTPRQAVPGTEVTPDEGGQASPEAKHWSPFSTRAARWSWGLMALFSVIYFAVAILTSKEFAEIAATMVFGLPLGFLLGMGMIIAGLVITRVYLAKIEA